MTPRRWAGWIVVCLLASICAVALTLGFGRLRGGAGPAALLVLDYTLLVLSLNYIVLYGGIIWMLLRAIQRFE